MSLNINDMVQKYITENGSKSPSTAQTLTTSLKRLTKILDKDFSKIQSKEFKEGEKENWIEYPELKKKVEELSTEYLTKKKAFTAFRNFLIVCLYVLMPPARIGNYLDMIKKDSSNMKRKAESLNKKNSILKIIIIILKLKIL